MFRLPNNSVFPVYSSHWLRKAYQKPFEYLMINSSRVVAYKTLCRSQQKHQYRAECHTERKLINNCPTKHLEPVTRTFYRKFNMETYEIFSWRQLKSLKLEIIANNQLLWMKKTTPKTQKARRHFFVCNKKKYEFRSRSIELVQVWFLINISLLMGLK